MLESLSNHAKVLSRAASWEHIVRGHILVSNTDGRRCLYVPESHIQFYVAKGGDRWVLCSFGTDGYYGLTEEDLVPTVEYLKQSHQFTAEVEIPHHIVEFAVENERRRQESIEGLMQTLAGAVQSGDRKDIFRKLLAERNEEKLDEDFGEEAENKIAEEINLLLAKTGGLQ